MGPFTEPPFPNSRVSRITTAEKDNGKIRVCLDLSYPPRKSVNDGIPKKDLKSRFPCLFDTVAVCFVLLGYIGTGGYMGKRDWESAYRQIGILVTSMNKLVFTWRGKFFVETRLPFGLRSAAGIHSRYSSLVKWMLQNVKDIWNTTVFADDHFFRGENSGSVRNIIGYRGHSL